MNRTTTSFARRRHFLTALALVLIAWLPQELAAQQSVDDQYSAAVETPAYKGKRPNVRFDEGHANYLTSSDRYMPFINLIKSDGVNVTIGKDKVFTKANLAGVDILVIVNARAQSAKNLRPRDARSGEPAFQSQELTDIVSWVESGGSLLLVADHGTFGSGKSGLAARFKVDMRGSLTHDPTNSEQSLMSNTALVFSAENGLLGDHAIIKGRNEAERVSRVVTFSGQSLSLLGEGTSLLSISQDAYDSFSAPGVDPVTAKDRFQGVALKYGSGRVVILGEAGMLTAQKFINNDGDVYLFGMNLPGCDNRQFALNIMHWLSGLLD